LSTGITMLIFAMIALTEIAVWALQAGLPAENDRPTTSPACCARDYRTAEPCGAGSTRHS